PRSFSRMGAGHKAGGWQVLSRLGPTCGFAHICAEAREGASGHFRCAIRRLTFLKAYGGSLHVVSTKAKHGPLQTCHPVCRRPDLPGAGRPRGDKVERPTGRTTLAPRGRSARLARVDGGRDGTPRNHPLTAPGRYGDLAIPQPEAP